MMILLSLVNYVLMNHDQNLSLTFLCISHLIYIRKDETRN